MKTISSVTREEITARAHDIWDQAGRPEGCELEHWLRAERELQSDREQAAAVAAPIAKGKRSAKSVDAPD